MNKIFIICAIAMLSITAIAAPFRPAFRPHRIHRPVRSHAVHRVHHPTPKPHHHHHHRRHHHCITAPIIAGTLGYVIGSTIAHPSPVVVTQPIVVRPTETTVWEDGHYEDQLQPNGTIVRVWVPGRYVKRIITP